MFEAELIEQLNDLDNNWRDKFDTVMDAAEYHGLLDLDDSDVPRELDFE